MEERRRLKREAKLKWKKQRREAWAAEQERRGEEESEESESVEGGSTTTAGSKRKQDPGLQHGARSKRAAVDPDPAAASPSGAEAGAWNDKDDLRLLRAISKVAPSVEGRWQLVARACPGKTAMECRMRTKALRSMRRTSTE